MQLFRWKGRGAVAGRSLDPQEATPRSRSTKVKGQVPGWLLFCLHTGVSVGSPGKESCKTYTTERHTDQNAALALSSWPFLGVGCGPCGCSCALGLSGSGLLSARCANHHQALISERKFNAFRVEQREQGKRSGGCTEEGQPKSQRWYYSGLDIMIVPFPDMKITNFIEYKKQSPWKLKFCPF